MKLSRIPRALLAARREAIESERRQRAAAREAERQAAEHKATLQADAKRTRRAPEWDPIAFVVGLFLGKRL